jgi:hypothetical protein
VSSAIPLRANKKAVGTFAFVTAYTHREKSDEYLNEILTGADTDGSPAAAVRRFLLKTAITAKGVNRDSEAPLFYLFRGWKDYCTGDAAPAFYRLPGTSVRGNPVGPHKLHEWDLFLEASGIGA